MDGLVNIEMGVISSRFENFPAIDKPGHTRFLQCNCRHSFDRFLSAITKREIVFIQLKFCIIDYKMRTGTYLLPIIDFKGLQPTPMVTQRFQSYLLKFCNDIITRELFSGSSRSSSFQLITRQILNFIFKVSKNELICFL